MKIGITTSSCSTTIHQCLKTCLAGAHSSGVLVSVDGEDDSFLGRWRSDSRVKVCRADYSGMERNRDRAFKNKLYVLQQLLADSPGDGVVIVEDDAIFARGWRKKLNRSVAGAPDFFEKQFAGCGNMRKMGPVSLYAPYQFINQPLSCYQVAKYYGGVAMWYPSSTLAEVVDAMATYLAKQQNSNEEVEPEDMWLKQWCMDTGTPIACTIPNIVQHNDDSSHKSPTFVESEEGDECDDDDEYLEDVVSSVTEQSPPEISSNQPAIIESEPGDDGPSPQVVVVLGTYNRLSFLKDAICSARRAIGGLTYKIVVVDGGSVDGSQKWLHEQPDVHLIEQSGPLTGAVVAFNLGFGYAVDVGSEFVMHINDDCIIEGVNAIRIAADMLVANPSAGAVAFQFDLRGPWVHEFVHSYVYVNFGLIRTRAGKQVAIKQGDPTGRKWWNPIYYTYGADSEFGVWLHHLGWGVIPSSELRVHDRAGETQDELRELNQANNPARPDSTLFWKRWPHDSSVMGGPS